MAVHCNLSTLMGKQRYSIQDVHIPTRIDFETLEKLCQLFRCHAGELFEVCVNDDSENNITENRMENIV